MLRPLVLLAVWLAASAAPAAAPSDDQRRYADCMRLAASRPTDAWEAALAWQGLGGGDAARHCAAAALIALGHHEEGALRLEELAQESRAAPAVRAGMLAQAAQAWLLAGQPQQALNDQAAALKLAPDDVELLLDRAATLGELGDFRAAIGDLDRALRLAPRRADALALRAGAWRMLNDLAAAERDAAAALRLDAGFPEALLESGIIAVQRGNPAQARRMWLKLLQGAPGSAAAEAARQHLERLDVKGAAH